MLLVFSPRHMNIQERITRQRVQHIVDSYRLDGDDSAQFANSLAQLLDVYPQPLIELALTEAIVKGWSNIPMRRGMPFLQIVYERLECWQSNLEGCNRSNAVCKIGNPQGVGAISLKKDLNSSPTESDAINTSLTPLQFEQITGLDASMVFDEHGKVCMTQSMSAKEPLEPR